MIWFKNGVELQLNEKRASGSNRYSVETLIDSNLTKLTVHDCKEDDDADYMLLVENIAGIDKSSFELIVEYSGNKNLGSH